MVMGKVCQKGQLAEWPTENLKKVLEKFTKVSSSVGTNIDTNKVEDITHTQEARLQLLEFLPKIRLLGPELKIERRGIDKKGTWGGAFVRVLMQKSTGERCLQYLFAYTRQLTIVSPLWWGIFPLMLAWLPGSLSAFFPLFMVCIFLHLFDSTEPFRARITTGLIIFWSIWVLEAFFSPIPFYLLNTMAIIFLGYFIYSIFTETQFSHMMDYIPVFVWIEHTDEGWVFKSAAWDIWHYKASKKSLEELTTSPWARLQPEGFVEKKKRIRLAIDNPWHSLYRRPHKMWFILVMLAGGFIATLILLSDFYPFPASWYAIHPRSTSADLVFVMAMTYISIVTRYEFRFIREEKKVVEGAEKLLKTHKEPGTAATNTEINELWGKVEFMPLCEENLDFLWNMVPKKDIEAGRFGRAVIRISNRVHRKPDEVNQARLIVISKLQDPFTDDWDTFLDD